MRDRPGLAVLALVLFVAAGAYGATLGWGTDRDSLRVMASAHAILAGTYLRSRSFGFPLHEAASALLAAIGGLLAVNLGTLAVTTGGIVLARRLVPPPRRTALVCVLCGCPLLLANSSSAIDFGWDFAASMALCASARRAARGAGFAAAYFLCATALLLLRPDNLLFVAAVTTVLLLKSGANRRTVIVATLAAGVVAGGIYLGLNGGGMLATGVTTTRPIAARLLRAAVFLVAALGPGGMLALAWLPGTTASFPTRVALLSWLLYVPRFVVLPDQLDYLVLPVTITIVAAMAALPPRRLAVVGILVVVPSLVTVSLLRRDPITGAVHPHVALQWGALPQDWAARRFAEQMAGPAMTQEVEARAGAGKLTYDVFMPGYVSARADLVIGRAHLYRVLPLGGGAGALATVKRAGYRDIWACDAALGPNSGWRGLEAPERAPAGDFSCGLASAAPKGQ
jgi:hypothetical protein